ncbi:MAG: nucleotidyltransferase domain-containing protein [Bacteroidota bacterium]
MTEVPQHIPEFLQVHLEEIQKLCRIHKVKSLWVFGSVLGASFSLDSDIDFLYEWDDKAISDEEYLDNLWTLLDALEELLGHKVDWVYYPTLENPYFKEEVEESKVLLYEQEAEEIFA